MKSAGGFRNISSCWKSGSRSGLASFYTSLTGVTFAWVVPEKVAVIDSVVRIRTNDNFDSLQACFRVKFRLMFQIGFRFRLSSAGEDGRRWVRVIMALLQQATLSPFHFFPARFFFFLTH